MPLTARQVETAKPKDKIYKIADGGGLYLQVNPNGSKYWRMKYHYAGKEKKLSFGTYPTITLAEARKRRDEAKKIHADGKDPGEVKKAENLEKNLSEGRTFAAIATEWYNAKVSGWSASYADYVDRAFKNNVFPYIGNRPISEIEPLELLAVLQRIESRGACELANKVRQRCGG